MFDSLFVLFLGCEKSPFSNVQWSFFPPKNVSQWLFADLVLLNANFEARKANREINDGSRRRTKHVKHLKRIYIETICKSGTNSR